jgi:hypothetical protein
MILAVVAAVATFGATLAAAVFVIITAMHWFMLWLDDYGDRWWHPGIFVAATMGVASSIVGCALVGGIAGATYVYGALT